MKMKKRLLSILLSLALVLGMLPGMSLTAYAEELSESFETNKSLNTYTGEHFTIWCEDSGDSDGFYLRTEFDHIATISSRNGEIITKAEFTRGWYNINDFRSEAGTVTYDGDVATVTGINATSLTIGAAGRLHIKAVKVYYSNPHTLDPTNFDDVAVASDSFTFKVVWKGGSDRNIDFTLYRKDGTVYRHGFDKQKLGSGEWKYSAWFSSPEICYVLETPMEGYQILYENVGVYAQVTDRCCDGGTITIHKVPKTGDTANPALWMGMVVIGAMTLCGVAVISKRRKESVTK